jgi:SAM-dependent methyltransferase
MQSAEYDSVASAYQRHRWPVQWKLDALTRELALSRPGIVIDAGCGTGDYMIAVRRSFPNHQFSGIDLSLQMLRVARLRCDSAGLVLGRADDAWPIQTGVAGLVYSIDVLQHLERLDVLFREVHRVLREDGRLLVITDSEDDLRARSLTRFFPTTLPFNLGRYPGIDSLVERAGAARFRCSGVSTCSGYLPFDDRLIDALESRAMSELRLITSAEHRAGMARVMAARNSGIGWLSQTTALTFAREA